MFFIIRLFCINVTYFHVNVINYADRNIHIIRIFSHDCFLVLLWYYGNVMGANE